METSKTGGPHLRLRISMSFQNASWTSMEASLGTWQMDKMYYINVFTPIRKYFPFAIAALFHQTYEHVMQAKRHFVPIRMRNNFQHNPAYNPKPFSRRCLAENTTALSVLFRLFTVFGTLIFHVPFRGSS